MTKPSQEIQPIEIIDDEPVEAPSMPIDLTAADDATPGEVSLSPPSTPSSGPSCADTDVLDLIDIDTESPSVASQEFSMKTFPELSNCRFQAVEYQVRASLDHEIQLELDFYFLYKNKPDAKEDLSQFDEDRIKPLVEKRMKALRMESDGSRGVQCANVYITARNIEFVLEKLQHGVHGIFDHDGTPIDSLGVFNVIKFDAVEPPSSPSSCADTDVLDLDAGADGDTPLHSAKQYFLDIDATVKQLPTLSFSLLYQCTVPDTPEAYAVAALVDRCSSALLSDTFSDETLREMMRKVGIHKSASVPLPGATPRKRPNLGIEVSCDRPNKSPKLAEEKVCSLINGFPISLSDRSVLGSWPSKARRDEILKEINTFQATSQPESSDSSASS
jgi:hypothetical protein